MNDKMYIIDGKCWKCSNDLKVALIHSIDFEKRGATIVGPSAFSKIEIEIAQSKGVIIQNQFSNTIQDSYLANTCNCGTFIGNHFLFTDYFHPAEMGDYNYEVVELLD